MAPSRTCGRPADPAVLAEIAKIAELHPGRVALVEHGGAITYARLMELAWEDADRLVHLAIGPGTRVALFSENRAGWLRCYLAIAAVGASLVALDEDAGATELDTLVERARPRAVVGSAAALARLGAELCARLAERGVPLLDVDRDLTPGRVAA